MKKVKFLIFGFLAMYLGNGYGFQEDVELKPGHVGSYTALFAFTASAVIQRIASNNQQSPYTTIAVSAVAAILCATPSYYMARHFATKIDSLKKKALDLKSDCNDLRSNYSVLNSLFQAELDQNSRKLTALTSEVEEAKNELQVAKNELQFKDNIISSYLGDIREQSLVIERLRASIRLDNVFGYVEPSKTIDFYPDPNTEFLEELVKNALSSSAEKSDVSSVDMFSWSSIPELLDGKNSLIMVNDGSGARAEGDAFYAWVMQKKNTGLITRIAYKDDDPLSITRYFKDPLTKKISSKSPLKISVRAFKSFYDPIIRNDLIGRIFALGNKQPLKDKRRNSF